MTSHLRNCLLSGLILVVISLAGCVTPNIREVNMGQVAARARLRDGKATFYQIEIRKPMSPGAPHLLLRLPGGKIIDRTTFTYNGLKQAGFVSGGNDFKPGSDYSHELARFGVSFFFNEGTLLLIRITETTGPGVGIAGVRKKEFRTLPLSQEDLETLFGRPDKTSEGYQLP